jgi:hypothetical protein
MTLSLYHSQRSMYFGRALIVGWDVWDFEPNGFASWRTDQGFVHFRDPSVEVLVRAPIGSEVVRTVMESRPSPVESRLRTHADPYGLTAASVYHLASQDTGGFWLIGPAPQFEPAAKELTCVSGANESGSAVEAAELDRWWLLGARRRGGRRP